MTQHTFSQAKALLGIPQLKHGAFYANTAPQNLNGTLDLQPHGLFSDFA